MRYKWSRATDDDDDNGIICNRTYEKREEDDDFWTRKETSCDIEVDTIGMIIHEKDER